MSQINRIELENKIFAWTKENWRELILPRCKKINFSPMAIPTSILMAGCTGAGKTEFSKNLVFLLNNMPGDSKTIRIDADEFYQELLKQFELHGDYRRECNSACIKLVERLADIALKQKQNLLLDSSFSSIKSLENIKRSLDKGRIVKIYFIYEKPKTAWYYVLQREKQENRRVNKEFFVQSYLGSLEMVQKAKVIYKDEISLSLWQKNEESVRQGIIVPKFSCLDDNIISLDKYIQKIYNKEEILKEIEND